jgi:hypothetical protein
VPPKPTKKPPERRTSLRFPIECDVHYRVIGRGTFEGFSSGKTVNMSGNGILLTADRMLSPGLPVEVEIDWPVRRTDGAPLKLVVRGRIVRSEKNDVALAGVRISRYTFQTASRWIVAGNT